MNFAFSFTAIKYKTIGIANRMDTATIPGELLSAKPKNIIRKRSIVERNKYMFLRISLNIILKIKLLINVYNKETTN
jgi:hypothetical protein